MWAISQGSSAIEIVYFERMSLDDLFSNFVILTRKQAIRGREGNSLLVHAHHHTLAHSLFFLSDSFFVSKFLVFSLIFHSFFLLFFSCFISCVFLPPSSVLLRLPLLCTAKALFILPTFNCFCPSIGVLPRPFIGLLAAQPSPLTCAGCAKFHSQTKEFYFVFLLFVAFPSK